MMQHLIRLLAGIPAVFDLLRWILEGGFSGHRTVFANELRSACVHERAAVNDGLSGSDNSTDADRGLILDLGCGTGQHAGQFRSDEYLGIDLSSTYLAAAGRRFPDCLWCQADATQLPLRDHSVTTVVISGLLHHLDEHLASRTLQETFRILKISGVLVVWEDIPTEAAWNLPGMLAHRLDLGKHIRTASGYRSLLEQKFLVISERKMRSGFMDYAVFVCKPRLTG